MSYPSKYNEQSDRFDVPLEAPPFEDFQSYFKARLSQLPQTTGPPFPSGSKRPQQQFPSIQSASDPNSWYSLADASSSSNSRPISGTYSFPSSSRTLDVSPLGLFYEPNTSSQNTHPPPFVPSTEDDYTFLANLEPSLLDTDIINVVNNSSLSYIPEPVGHGSSPSRKRPRANEAPESNNASIDAFSNLKHRRVSTNGHQTLPSVPSTNAYNNSNNNKNNYIMTNTFNDFSLPASTPRANTTLSSTPYPNPQIFHDAPTHSVPLPPTPSVLLPPLHVGATQPSPTASHRTAIDNKAWWNPNVDLYAPLVNLSPPPPVAIPPTYFPGTQFYPNAYAGNEGAVESTLGLNGNGHGDLYNAAGPSQADVLPLSYFTLSDAENGPLDWTAGLLGPEQFYNTTAVASVGSSSVQVVPPFLEQQTPVYHTNAVANNATNSSVVDFRQHSDTTTQISTRGHVANATMPNAQVPSTSGAPSVDPLTITYEILEPTPPSSPSPICSPKRKRKPTLYPDEKLWFRRGDEFVCRYKGPGCPEGCAQKSDTPRNLGRHMRKHAKTEAGMQDLSPNERVAINGMPEELLRVRAACKLPRAKLHQCAFYREHGRRWVVMTMEREDNLERKHNDSNHGPDQQQSRPQKKRKKKV